MNWEPWTGCVPYSEGCKYCYYYDPYAKRYGQNEITKTDKFDWPIRRNAKGELCIKGGKTVATCFATDFFIPGADEWRKDAWAMIKERQDLEFMILTKRIDRFYESLPEDWGDGYDNVYLGCTVETQKIADYPIVIVFSQFGEGMWNRYIGEQINFEFGNATTFLSMTLLGCSFAAVSAKVFKGKWKTYLFIILKMLAIPVVLGYLLSILKVNEHMVQAFVLLAAMPAGNMPLMLAKQVGEDTEVLTQGILLTTIVTPLSLLLVTLVL